jgi:hypothetical protein
MYGPGLYEHRTSRRNNMLAGLCLQPGAWDATTGAMEQVNVSDVTMRNVTTPLFCVVKPGNTAHGISINRLTATGVYRTASSFESWAESPIRGVSLSDVTIHFRGSAASASAAREVRGPGVDARPLPAWGLFARRVENLRLENVRLSSDGRTETPPILCEDVSRMEVDGLRCPPGSRLSVFMRVEHLAARDADPPLPAQPSGG